MAKKIKDSDRLVVAWATKDGYKTWFVSHKSLKKSPVVINDGEFEKYAGPLTDAIELIEDDPSIKLSYAAGKFSFFKGNSLIEITVVKNDSVKEK